MRLIEDYNEDYLSASSAPILTRTIQAEVPADKATREFQVGVYSTLGHLMAGDWQLQNEFEEEVMTDVIRCLLANAERQGLPVFDESVQQGL